VEIGDLFRVRVRLGERRRKRQKNEKGNGESKWEWSFGLWWDQKEGETVVVVCLLGLVVG
jgi:hypothetical protein